MSSPVSLDHRRTSAALLRLGTVLIAIAKSSAQTDPPPGKENAAEGESAAREGR